MCILIFMLIYLIQKKIIMIYQLTTLLHFAEHYHQTTFSSLFVNQIYLQEAMASSLCSDCVFVEATMTGDK